MRATAGAKKQTQKTRPPPPCFTPPPPPSSEELLDTVYSEIEHRPYLDVLPEDGDKMSLGKSTIRYQTGYYSPQQQTSEDAEDINGMLRWLKKVSKSDFMALSMYGLRIEEEIRLFSERAMNVRKALRLYNLLMMKRNESLRNIITELASISDSLDKMKKKGKTMDIAGGTTGAVGGMTAVLGIAFAPATLGASLIATVIGAGMMASAGGMGAHTAKANKKLVNRMTVEKLIYDYKANIVDLEHCLGFILDGMNELQRHDIARLQRAGAQPDSVKMAHLSQFVFQNNIKKNSGTSLGHTRGMSSERLLLAFVKEMDVYFKEKDEQKLKKSSKSKFSGRVRLLAQNLQEELHQLNHMWEMFG
ncbi:apolipoprotein L6-like [Clinocottus analis]|uniref:apolipoprotein L6-like n=1 Tax=Clinocottus analis TaxID=304258 RepID=UPI0035C2205E